MQCVAQRLKPAHPAKATLKAGCAWPGRRHPERMTDGWRARLIRTWFFAGVGALIGAQDPLSIPRQFAGSMDGPLQSVLVAAVVAITLAAFQLVWWAVRRNNLSRVQLSLETVGWALLALVAFPVGRMVGTELGYVIMGSAALLAVIQNWAKPRDAEKLLS